MKHTEWMSRTIYPRTIALTLTLAILLASLGTSIANIALPALAQAFSAPFGQVQGVVISYLAALTFSVVIAGQLGDRFGLKPMLLVGLGVFAVGSVLCALSPNLSALTAARAVQGTGAAFMMTLAMAMMRQTASDGHLGRAMGLLGTVSALGTALGPSMGGVLISATGWRGIFWVQAPLAMLALILAFGFLPAASGTARTTSGAVRSAITMRLASNLLVNFLVAAVMMTTLVVGPFFLGLGLGLHAAQVGLFMAAGPLMSILSGIPSGRLADAWGSQRMLILGLAMLTAGSLLLALLPNMVGVAGYLAAICVLTSGYQLFQAANNTAALADVPADRRGTVSGLLSLSRNLGLIAGASAMGAVFAWSVGAGDIASASPAAIAAGMRVTLLLAGGLMACAVWIALAAARFADTAQWPQRESAA